MSDKSPNAIYLGMQADCEEENVENVEATTAITKDVRCVKLSLDDHIRAYIERKDILENQIEVIQCSNNLLESVILNYIIVKEILWNLPWQDKLLSAQVCSTWHSALQTLRKEQLGPEDFVIDFCSRSLTCLTIYKKSGNFYNEPLVVMTFANPAGFGMTCKCKTIKPSPCQEPCKKEHSLLDLVHKYSSAPKDCMTIVRSEYLIYMPLPQSVTNQDTITQLKSQPFIGGIYIPCIPNVKFHTINMKLYQQNICSVVDSLVKDRIIKGILVYVTDKYLLHSVEDIVFLNYFKEVQPDIPYALGGCIIEDTVFEQKDLVGIVDGINESNDFISDNLISIGIFTVPKGGSNEFNFDMFSLILESSDWTKAKIQQSINEFARKVPHFEHSAVIKLSCVGRDQKHKFEQECFRAVFPNTIIVGCYGNGELGINHPEKPPPEMPSAKRHRRDPGPQFGLMYSYSTVFVYMGWGKITSPAVVL